LGFEINWNTNKGNTRLFNHPLYIKYNSQLLGAIDASQVKADLELVMATADSAEVCAYLAWLIRTTALLQP
jgi:hypothetical protein